MVLTLHIITLAVNNALYKAEIVEVRRSKKCGDVLSFTVRTTSGRIFKSAYYRSKRNIKRALWVLFLLISCSFRTWCPGCAPDELF